jgi:hypothetical protein
LTHATSRASAGSDNAIIPGGEVASPTQRDRHARAFSAQDNRHAMTTTGVMPPGTRLTLQCPIQVPAGSWCACEVTMNRRTSLIGPLIIGIMPNMSEIAVFNQGHPLANIQLAPGQAYSASEFSVHGNTLLFHHS